MPGWFVPPIVVPIALILLLAAIVAFRALL